MDGGCLRPSPGRDFLPVVAGRRPLDFLCLSVSDWGVSSGGALAPSAWPPLVGGVGHGETWCFQLWYRDRDPVATTNFSDGLRVLFE